MDKKSVRSRKKALLLAAAMLVVAQAGLCAGSSEQKATEKITVDLFGSVANYQGIQPGWYGKILLDKFNIELNIIAPNVAGGGDTLFLTRSAAGNLGDIIHIREDKLKDTYKAGLLMDMSSVLQSHGANYVTKFPNAIKKIKTYLGTDRVYAIPTDVSTQSPLAPLNFGDPDYGFYMRWDYFTGIGSPVIKSLDDMLSVLKRMQDKYPTSESGKKTYGFSFFKDWDGDGVMQNAALFPSMYGYTFLKSCFLKADPSTTVTEPVLDDNGIYYKTLKMYFEANQMGLVDPDSSSQNWDTLWNKTQDGQVLFSWWPWLGKGAYNSEARSAQGKGFAFVPVHDAKIACAGFDPNGQYSMVIGLGSRTKYPERLMELIDWMCSPEGIRIATAGPLGLTWEIKDGRPVLTEYGKSASVNNLPVPAEYGGGGYRDGGPQINFGMVLGCEIDPQTNEPYDYWRWQSTIESASTSLDKAWQSAVGASDTMDYLKKHDMLVVAPGSGYVAPPDSSDIQTKRSQSGQAIINASWQMVFAKDQAQFDAIWQTMKAQAKGFGYDDVLAWDRRIAEELNAARSRTLAESR